MMIHTLDWWYTALHHFIMDFHVQNFWWLKTVYNFTYIKSQLQPSILEYSLVCEKETMTKVSIKKYVM